MRNARPTYRSLRVLAIGALSTLALTGAQKGEESVNWLTFEEAVKLQQTAPRKMMVDVYTSWCGWCKVMDKKTFSHPVIRRQLNEEFYAVKLDAEQREPIKIGPNEFKYVETEGSRGYNELAVALLQGQMSFPTVVFLDEKMQLIQPVPGYQEAATMETILDYIEGDHYRSTDWSAFSATHRGQVAVAK